MIEKSYLEKRYVKERRSVAEISTELVCSQSKVTYWLFKHNISKRSVSEAQYVKKNPEGNPFEFNSFISVDRNQQICFNDHNVFSGPMK